MIVSISAMGAIISDKIDFLQDFKNWIGFGDETQRRSKNKYIDYVYLFIGHLINCPCIAFWLGFYWLGIPQAFLCYYLSTVIWKNMNKIA